MPETHVVLTGPIKGDVTLADGTVVDVGAREVVVDSPEQAAEVARLIGDRYAAEGHPEHLHGDGFVHDSKTTDANLTALEG